MKIEIEDLKKVKLNEGDILIVTMDMDITSNDDRDETLKILKDIFPKNEILSKPKEIELSVITKEDKDENRNRP